MARSDTVTQLPLDRYAEIMQIPLPHFNQLNGNKAPTIKGCEGGIWDQQARDNLAWIVAQAEEMIAIELSAWPAPKFITAEHQPVNLDGVRFDWMNAENKTDWSYVEGFGSELLTLIEAGATVTYSDDDGDPFEREELATIGTSLYDFLPACDNECEVAIFFRVADGADDAADPRWEIKPFRVDIDDTTMTIKADASMFVKPDLWKLTKQLVTGSEDNNSWIVNYDTNNFVSFVDVYCRTIDPQLPVTIKWDGICRCTSPCSHETQAGCAYCTDLKHGFFVPRTATWNGITHLEAIPVNRTPPESIMVNYRAGFPLDRNCRMNPSLERAIVKLTNALLPEPPCNFCDQAKNLWNQDREPIDPLTPEAASLPWDVYARGALEAWRIIKMFRFGRGGKLGR
jgi:hypothetical protein